MKNVDHQGKCFRLKDVLIPEAVMQLGRRRHLTYQNISFIGFLHWPDGTPCVAINQYLVDRNYEWTGGTSQTYAFALSHLVAYCGKREMGFCELTDGDVKDFIDGLRQDVCTKTAEFKRNNNTVRSIIQRCIAFLMWYQDTLYRGANPLIGKSDLGPKIVISEKWNSHKQTKEWVHRYMPEPVSTERKLAISRLALTAIEDAIESKGVRAKVHERLRRAHRCDDKFLDRCVDYLWARRRFLLWLLQTTGLRPGEMMMLSVTDFERVAASPSGEAAHLSIPTLKRRRIDPPRRPFVLFGAQVEIVRRYLWARGCWLAACRSHLDDGFNSDAIFLATSPGRCGRPVSLSALEKDFSELRIDAGLGEQQVCFSMFRHRFITQEIRYLLKEFKLTHGAIVSDADYWAILERVRVKTGHADVRSLWHYIALAHNDDGLWDSIENFEERLAKVDLQRERIAAVRRELSTGAIQMEDLAEILAEIDRGLSNV